jgi:hypothetical protein
MDARLPRRLSNDDLLLAQELAARLRPWDDVAEDFGLTIDQINHKLDVDEQFAALVQDAQAEWRANKSIRPRIRSKAAVAVEMALPQLAADAMTAESPAERVAAFKQLMRLADLEPKPDGMGGHSGPTFSLTLNLSGDPSRPPLVLGNPDPDPPIELEDAA